MTRKNTVFLDSSIFFESIDDNRVLSTFSHAKNKGFDLLTSITVIGETFNKIVSKKELSYLENFYGFMKDLDVITLYPSRELSIICYNLGNDFDDTRMVPESTDKTHLGYAIAYECEYFITTDKNLKKYHIPKKLEDIRFYKPKTLDIDEFREIINS